jgi:hypothetical protein
MVLLEFVCIEPQEL